MKPEVLRMLNSPKLANDAFQRFRISPAAEQASALIYWRERILFYTILSGSVLGFIAYVPSIYLAFQDKLWWVIGIDTIVYGWAVSLLFLKRVGFIYRAVSLLIIVYTLGVLFIIYFGPYAGGPVWLFAFPVLTGVLLGFRPAILSLLINMMTLTVTVILFYQGVLSWPSPINLSIDKFVMISINFIFLNSVTTISLAVLVEGLKKSIEKENASKLEKEHKNKLLAQANKKLTVEIEQRRQLEAQTMRLGEIFDQSLNEIYLFEADSLKFIQVNRGATKSLGYSSEELMQLTPLDIKPELLPEDLAAHIKSLRRGEKQVIVWATSHKRKDGSTYPVEEHLQLIESSSFSIFVSVALDITDRKKAEQEKIKLEYQLQQAYKMESIGTLAGGIAHDFNNILSAIIGFTELALDKVEEDSSIADNLQEVYTAGKRAKDLVRQILAFARQSDEELKPIQVDTIAKEVLRFIRSSIPTTIEIRQNLESDSLIMGNATQVHQVMMNLCTNASHAMEDQGGVLQVDLKDVAVDATSAKAKPKLNPGNYIEIRVSDTGAGIPPGIMGSIFEPYFTTKSLGEGTGMGLATVHGIIESYGGKIFVDSTLGKGSTFSVYLPVTRARTDHSLYKQTALPSGAEKILFVDDEAPIAKLGSQTLERLGYSVATRTSSVEALELFRSKPDDFDLVVTDMTMPNMTGDKLATELIKIRSDIPIILCTGYSKKISDESAADMGIKAIAYKPIVMADLAKTVRKVLDAAK